VENGSLRPRCHKGGSQHELREEGEEKRGSRGSKLSKPAGILKKKSPQQETAKIEIYMKGK